MNRGRKNFLNTHLVSRCGERAYSRFHEPDLTVDVDSPFVRDVAVLGLLVAQMDWLLAFTRYPD